MTLADPTGGTGYLPGAILPSTHMTTIAANQPKAVDGNGGGTWTPSAPIILNGSALQLGDQLFYTSRSVSRKQSYQAQTLSANWTLGPTYTWRNDGAMPGGEIMFWLDRLANEAELTSLTMRWQGAAGHVGQPGTMPRLRLMQYDQDNTETVLGSVNDTWTSIAAYQTAHDVTLSLVGVTLDLVQYRYMAEITGELGANYVAGAQVFSLTATMDITKQSEV
jgi:hypothetical protein